MKDVECNDDDCKTCKNKCYMSISVPYRYTKKGIVDEYGFEVKGDDL
jgi:hypothetical protein